MAKLKAPFALDRSLNTTEQASRNIADVLAEELSAIITALGGLNFINYEVVEELPATGISTTTIYLVPSDDPQSGNTYDEYINLNGTVSGWEKIGSTAIDLSGYYTSAETDALLDEKVDKDSFDEQTATDEFTTINGGLLSECKVALSPNQDLHGYSEPWVGGSRKNKIGASGGWNGSGVLEPSARAIRSEQIAVNEGDKFIASKAETFNATYANLQALEFDSSKAFIRQTSILAYSALNGTAFTVPSGTAYVAFSVYFNSTDEANIDAKKVQVEKGDNITTFEPYSNICPISGHTQVEVGDDGINLISGIENGAVDDYGSPSTSTYRCRTVDFIHIKPNTQYTLKALSDDGTLEYLVRTFEDADGSYRISDNDGWHQGAFTFTSQANAHDLKVIFRFNNNASIDASQIYNVQLELGSTATEYAPYNGYQVTVNLGGTYYSGTLDIVTGVFTPDMASVDLGTLTWTYDSGTQRFTSSVTGLKNLPVRTAPMTCEVYKVIDDGRAIGDVPDGSIYNGNMSSNVYVHDSRFTAPSDLATALSGYKLVYPLATPTPIQLSPTMVKALVGKNHLSAPLDGQEITESKYRELFTWDEVEAYVNAHSGGGSGMNYSTEEQVVGTWIDGKPLYQKTWDLGQDITVGAWTSVMSIADVNIDVLVNSISVQNSKSISQIEYWVDGTTLKGNTLRPNTAVDYVRYLTLQYTKITD